MKKPQAGFSIVELIVVITVIGILAAITVVSYRSVQRNANDAAIKDAVAQMSDAIQLWSTRTNNKPGAALYAGTSFASGYAQAGTYVTTPESTLIAAGYLPPQFTADLNSISVPTGLSKHIIMFYPCSNERYALYASLNNASKQAEYQAKASSAGCPVDVFTSASYKMNYIVIF